MNCNNNFCLILKGLTNVKEAMNETKQKAIKRCLFFLERMFLNFKIQKKSIPDKIEIFDRNEQFKKKKNIF